MSITSKFPYKNELRRFARNFVKERVIYLQKDVNHCLQPPYAPFPAILYCLATIDLLEALCAGQVSIEILQQEREHLLIPKKIRNRICDYLWVIPKNKANL